MYIQRVDSDPIPYLDVLASQGLWTAFRWPAKWVACPGANQTPIVLAFRLRLNLSEPQSARIHISADERYELFIDGKRVARGPERGDPQGWFYETFLLDLSPGTHTIVARVWAFGEAAPFAQMSIEPAFLFCSDGPLGPLVDTGTAAWEVKVLGGYGWAAPARFKFNDSTGRKQAIDGTGRDWGVERGEGEGWQPVVALYEAEVGYPTDLHSRRILRPGTFPQMIEQPVPPGVVRHVADDGPADAVLRANHLSSEADSWQRFIERAAPLHIPARTRRRVIVDLKDYFCAYPRLTCSGGGGTSIGIGWAESLFVNPIIPQHGNAKGNRNEIEGRYFGGLNDVFLLDGGEARLFETLWWQAGRYVEITIQTADQPVELSRLDFTETRYPLDMEARFDCDDPRIVKLMPMLVRSMQACLHEHYMDSPYYEQLMYIGDTRVEALVTYVMTHDPRPPRKATTMFDHSRMVDGFTQSRYPSRKAQVIPTFSMVYVQMIEDSLMWHGDKTFVRARMPGARGIIDACLRHQDADGLIGRLPGWPFMDWSQFHYGMPHNAFYGASCAVNWQFVTTLESIARLENLLGEPELAARANRLAGALAARIHTTFWDESRGLYTDDASGKHYYEHTQIWALLSTQLSPATRDRLGRGLIDAQDLARSTIYFAHYLYEVLGQMGRDDLILKHLQLWFDAQAMGLCCTPESPEPTRSDCHAWGAHPLYHFFATLLGIRPASPGFQTVRITPCLHTLRNASGRMPHPRGEIAADFRVDNGLLKGTIELPKGITGELVCGEKSYALHDGTQKVSVDYPRPSVMVASV